MASIKILYTVFCLVVFFQSHTEAKETEPITNLTTAHDELANNGFPSGLLPNTVVTYSLNKSSGEFSVQLNKRCDIILPPDNYPASYSELITGKITEGYIHGLDGIHVKAFFKWWAITGIRSSGKNLVFEVGMVTAKYPSVNFDESPDCEGGHSSS